MAIRWWAKSTMPTSKTSSSGLTPSSSILPASALMVSGELTDGSRAKFSEPSVSDAISGRESSAAARSSRSGQVRPLVVTQVITSERSRSGSRISR